MEILGLKMKELFMELLKDEEIGTAIADIVRARNGQNGSANEIYMQQRMIELEAEIENLMAKKKELEEENKRLAVWKGELETENAELKLGRAELVKDKNEFKNRNQELTEENTGLKGQLEKLSEKLRPVKKAADIWQELMVMDQADMEFLDQLSGDRNILAYVATGNDYTKIKQLWNYVRDKAQKEETDESVIHGLSDYFDMCIEIYNITNNRNEKFEKIADLKHSEFDSENCIKTSKSQLNGIVSKILVNGYKSQDGRVVFQAVVRVQ